ncbi:hypothetical protein [Limnothrix sp. PR1529]|uniref:hypothetical protein n=1 Tax=Limnothrix sp. PR1529 TaxID=1704291 RepID=UPI00081DDFBF|nr:hypothetical protein [Limnothrix sp. PR1529]OCQ96232.1 hypothetical protein BCR12_14250 [Limnothrix sp. P13C2]
MIMHKTYAIALLSLSLITACQSGSTNQSTASNNAPATIPSSSPIAPADPSVKHFDEALYALAYPEVNEQVKAGKFASPLAHYQAVGQSGKDANGEAIAGFFMGTGSNDTISGFGHHPHISGVAFEIVADKGGELPIRPKTLGQGEVDRLVGQPGSEDEFIVGSLITPANPKSAPFYVGKGDADYAQIDNFKPGEDTILLAGKPEDYNLQPQDKTLRISTKSGDLVAIVQGVDRLTVGDVVADYGIFILK